MQSRLRSTQRFIEKEELDGFLLSNLINIRYLTGFTGSSAILLILPKDAIFFTDFRYKEQVKQEVKGCAIRIIKQSLLDDTARSPVMKGRKKVGFESRSLIFSDYSKLKGLLPGVELLPFDSVVEPLRMRKTASELRRIKKAVDIADSVFEKVLAILKPGVREIEIAAEIEHLFKFKGGSGPSFPTIVASGSRSALPHARSSKKRLKKGELVLFDLGTVYDGYCSDLSRTVVLGRATPKQKSIYSLVLSAQKRAIASMRRGMKLSTLDRKARDVIKEAGYGKNFGHSLGHGVGLNVHELPGVHSKSTERVSEGMVFTIEPGVYIPRWGGVRIEDMVAVTSDGCRVLTKSPKELIEL